MSQIGNKYFGFDIPQSMQTLSVQTPAVQKEVTSPIIIEQKPDTVELADKKTQKKPSKKKILLFAGGALAVGGLAWGVKTGKIQALVKKVFRRSKQVNDLNSNSVIINGSDVGNRLRRNGSDIKPQASLEREASEAITQNTPLEQKALEVVSQNTSLEQKALEATTQNNTANEVISVIAPRATSVKQEISHEVVQDIPLKKEASGAKLQAVVLEQPSPIASPRATSVKQEISHEVVQDIPLKKEASGAKLQAVVSEQPSPIASPKVTSAKQEAVETVTQIKPEPMPLGLPEKSSATTNKEVEAQAKNAFNKGIKGSIFSGAIATTIGAGAGVVAVQLKDSGKSLETERLEDTIKGKKEYIKNSDVPRTKLSANECIEQFNGSAEAVGILAKRANALSARADSFTKMFLSTKLKNGGYANVENGDGFIIRKGDKDTFVMDTYKDNLKTYSLEIKKALPHKITSYGAEGQVTSEGKYSTVSKGGKIYHHMSHFVSYKKTGEHVGTLILDTKGRPKSVFLRENDGEAIKKMYSLNTDGELATVCLTTDGKKIDKRFSYENTELKKAELGEDKKLPPREYEFVDGEVKTIKAKAFTPDGLVEVTVNLDE